MKKFIVLLILVCAVSVSARDQDLTTPKDLIPSTAEGIRSGFSMDANTDGKIVTYDYYWLDSTGIRIYPYGGRANGKQTLDCKEWDIVPAVRVGDCVAVDDPHDCCTGEDAGTCDDAAENTGCTAAGEPYECCTEAAEGICDCWDDIRLLLVPVRNLLDGEVDKWENIERD